MFNWRFSYDGKKRLGDGKLEWKAPERDQLHCEGVPGRITTIAPSLLVIARYHPFLRDT